MTCVMRIRWNQSMNTMLAVIGAIAVIVAEGDWGNSCEGSRSRRTSASGDSLLPSCPFGPGKSGEEPGGRWPGRSVTVTRSWLRRNAGQTRQRPAMHENMIQRVAVLAPSWMLEMTHVPSTPTHQKSTSSLVAEGVSVDDERGRSDAGTTCAPEKSSGLGGGAKNRGPVTGVASGVTSGINMFSAGGGTACGSGEPGGPAGSGDGLSLSGSFTVQKCIAPRAGSPWATCYLSQA